MTTIAIWLNKEEGESIWAVSDSRITGSNSQVMIDDCPKLFEVPLQVYYDAKQVLQVKVASIIMCFSGNSLLGQTSFVKLASLLGSLQSSRGGKFDFKNIISDLPGMEEIAILLKKLTEISAKELAMYKFKVNADPPATNIAIFGFCHRENRLRCFSLITSKVCYSEFEIEEVCLNSREYFLMGDEKQSISKKIDQIRSAEKQGSLPWWRSPGLAIKEIVESGVHSTIGGNLQLAQAYNSGANIMFHINEYDFTEETFKLGDFISTPKMISI